jgi:hypothetical protein
MDKARFIQVLDCDSRDYSNRPLLAEAVLEHPDWIFIVLEKMSDLENKNSDMSARVLELACKENLSLIFLGLDEFSTLISELRLDGSIRASAKIIELLCIEYFVKFNPLYIKNLKDSHLEQFTESCFDWMITDKAIAIQAHSMYSLYMLGIKYDWVHTELVQNIERNLPQGSAGYQNRGGKIINAIKTDRILKLY